MSPLRSLVVLLLAVPTAAWAHDVSVDVSGTLTTSSDNNPRAGGVALGLSGAWDVSEQVSLVGLAVFTRDLGTRTSESFSPGSNVFLLNLGVQWLPTDNLMTMLTVLGSPPVVQPSATTVELSAGRTADVVINSRTWSVGALWNGGWLSTGESRWEHTVDVLAGAARFDVFQQVQVPDTPRGALLRAACDGALAGEPACRLVRGAATPLWQGRFGGGYTATLFQKTDVGLEVTGFLYDRPPADVGYFSLVAFGRAELGNGVPVLPLLVSFRPHLAQRLGPVTLKLSYQGALYTAGLGALHAATVRASWKVTKAWRLSLVVTGQFDVSAGRLSNPGGQALLGTTWVF